MQSSKESGTKESLKPQIEAVIFDLDGLLIDSEPVWQKAYIRFLTVNNLKEDLSVESVRKGMGLREIIKLSKKDVSDDELERLLGNLRAIFYEMFFESAHFKLLDGAEELIKSMHGCYQLAVATGGHTRDKCSQILKNLRIDGYFDVVVSSDDVEEGKPAPDVYIYTAEKLGVESAKCLVLEDSINGVLSARAAQAEVFGVNPDEKTREQLDKAGADRVFKSLSEVQIP